MDGGGGLVLVVLSKIGEFPTMTKGEQETIIRWDQEERVAHLWTAYETDANRWIAAGYQVRVSGRNERGRPIGWATEVPIDAIRWKRVKDGCVVRRRGHRKGRVFAVRSDQLVVSEALS